jgi:hypothetical protein
MGSIYNKDLLWATDGTAVVPNMPTEGKVWAGSYSLRVAGWAVAGYRKVRIELRRADGIAMAVPSAMAEDYYHRLVCTDPYVECHFGGENNVGSGNPNTWGTWTENTDGSILYEGFLREEIENIDDPDLMARSVNHVFPYNGIQCLNVWDAELGQDVYLPVTDLVAMLHDAHGNLFHDNQYDGGPSTYDDGMDDAAYVRDAPIWTAGATQYVANNTFLSSRAERFCAYKWLDNVGGIAMPSVLDPIALYYPIIAYNLTSEPAPHQLDNESLQVCLAPQSLVINLYNMTEPIVISKLEFYEPYVDPASLLGFERRE